MLMKSKIILGYSALTAAFLFGLTACSVPESDKSSAAPMVETQQSSNAVDTRNLTPDDLFQESLRALNSNESDATLVQNRFVQLTQAAAERGQLDAINNMGAIYMHGMGDVKADLDKSLAWYERLAKSPDPSQATDGHRNAGYILYQQYKATHNRLLLDKALAQWNAAHPDDGGAQMLKAIALVDSGLDPEAGKKILKEFAEHGSPTAKDFLAKNQ